MKSADFLSFYEKKEIQNESSLTFFKNSRIEKEKLFVFFWFFEKKVHCSHKKEIKNRIKKPRSSGFLNKKPEDLAAVPQKKIFKLKK
jgi:hypothetical protein